LDIIKGIIMGLVQGLTEFLPISSSGHLVLAGSILNIGSKSGLFFEVMMHVGTLISVFFVFGSDIIELIKEFFGLIGDILSRRKPYVKNNEYRNMLVMVIIASVPTGLVGILFDDLFERAFSSVAIVSVMLMITGLLLFYGDRLKKGNKTIGRIKVLDALIIGLFQGLAITPGISRSGSTIVASLSRGLTRETATKFSFILSIPAILGASAIELISFAGTAAGNENFAMILAGMVAAAVSGVFAIRFLISLLNRGGLHYFSYYCWAIGITGLCLTLI
jgi:undecaprenyl-diphosphatase